MKIWKEVPGHSQGGYFCKTTKSTKVPISCPKSDAQRAASEMERIGQELKTVRGMDRTTFEKRVESLMRAAGVEIPRKRTTWKEFSEQFLNESDAGEKSILKYRGEIAQFSRFLGTRAGHDLREIIHQDIAAFYRNLQDEGRSAGTAKNTTKTIRAVLQRALLLNYIESNPAALVRLKSNAGVSESSREPFTQNEIRRLFEIVTGERRIAFLFGLTYGLRAGDAARRRFEEIEIRDGIHCISFVPEKKRRTGRTITLPLVGELAELLQVQNGSGYITPSLAPLQHPGRWLERSMQEAGIDRKVKEAKKGKGRSVSAKTFHSLRHTISSWLMASGADLRMRQLVCDHDDPRINARYTHASLLGMSKAITQALPEIAGCAKSDQRCS